jgi:hypothetical protein
MAVGVRRFAALLSLLVVAGAGYFAVDALADDGLPGVTISTAVTLPPPPPLPTVSVAVLPPPPPVLPPPPALPVSTCDCSPPPPPAPVQVQTSSGSLSASTSVSSTSGDSTRTGVSANTSAGSGGGSSVFAAPRGSSGSVSGRTRRTDDPGPQPTAVGSGQDGDFVIQVPAAANGTFAAYIFFMLFGNPATPGVLPSFLVPNGLAATADHNRNQKAAGAESSPAGAESSRGGALGAAARRLAPDVDELVRLPLWWLYLAVATLLSALAPTVLVAFRRRLFRPRGV